MRQGRPFVRQEYKSDKNSVGENLRRTHAASQLKRNAQWLLNLRRRGLIKRKRTTEIYVFIYSTCRPNVIREKIIKKYSKKSLVEVESKNIALPF